MTAEMNYEKDLAIDLLALHTEWNAQPRVFMRYAKALADRRDQMERAKEGVEVERAEADKRARARYAGAEKKPTEGVINSEVLTDRVYQDANSNYLRLKYEVDILTAAVRAFDQRKDALENLVRLHGQQYFAGPAVPYEVGRQFVEAAGEAGRGEARDRVAERTRRRP